MIYVCGRSVPAFFVGAELAPPAGAFISKVGIDCCVCGRLISAPTAKEGVSAPNVGADIIRPSVRNNLGLELIAGFSGRRGATR